MVFEAIAELVAERVEKDVSEITMESNFRDLGIDATTLIFGDGGKLPHPDGRPTHTFRSYTAFFSGERVPP